MAETSEGDSTTEFMKYKVADLRKLLKSRGLSTAGNKLELVERLQQACETASVDDLLESGAIGDEEGLDDEELEEELNESVESLLADDKVLQTEIKRKLTDVEATEKKEDGKAKEVEPPEKKRRLISRNLANLPEELLETKSDEKSADDKESKTVENAEESGENATGEKSTNGETGKRMVKIKPLSTKERLELRAQKFGVTELSETAKKELRAARFGIPTKSTLNETLKKRAERFGIASSPTGPASDALKKRAERFGLGSTSTNSTNNSKEKMEARKIRFGAETDEKKLMRAERFKVAT